MTCIAVYTYSKIKSQKSHTRYLISSQGILHFTEQLKKRGDVSSIQLICMTKQRKQILTPKTKRYETKTNKSSKKYIHIER